MLRAGFPWGDVGAQLENGHRAAELEGPGSPWRPLASWAVGMGLYFRGENDEADRWFAESAALAPASAQWLCGVSSLAFRSRIAGERGRLEEQRMLAETAAEFGREHGTEKAGRHGSAGAGGIARGARPARGGTAADRARRRPGSRTFGQPIQLAYALLGQAPVLRGLGEHQPCRGCDSRGQIRPPILPRPGDPGRQAGRPGPATADPPRSDPEIRS